MPIYQFTCEKCNQTVEELMPAGERDKPRPCSTCGGPARRIMSMFATVRPASATAPVASSGKSCGSCHSHSCGSCHH